MDKGKHNKPKPRVATSESDGLTHSPFATLGGSLNQTVPAQQETPAEVSPAAEKNPFRGRILLRRETKKRGGKAVIVVYGFAPASELADEKLQALATELKQTLGCGGTLEHKDGGPGSRAERELVLQGDQPARVAELLRAKGFTVAGVTS